jgi:hypothetical protein
MSRYNRGCDMSQRTTSVILAFAFDVIFVAALLVFALFVPNTTIQQFEIVRIILALAAGGVAAIIPGFLNLQLGAGAHLTLRAGGALAVFAIVYSPAHWAPSPATNITQSTTGPNSPATIGNNNVVGAPSSAADKPRLPFAASWGESLPQQLTHDKQPPARTVRRSSATTIISHITISTRERSSASMISSMKRT